MYEDEVKKVLVDKDTPPDLKKFLIKFKKYYQHLI